MDSRLQVLLLILLSLICAEAQSDNVSELPVLTLQKDLPTSCNDNNNSNNVSSNSNVKKSTTNENQQENRSTVIKQKTLEFSDQLEKHNIPLNGLKILELLDGTRNKNESADVSTTVASSTDGSIYTNYSALANFKGEIDPAFLKRINPHWLKFPAQSPSAHYILATIYFIMMVFGLTGNSLVIYIYLKFQSVRTPANNLIFNLAICDFIIMLEAPIFIYNSMHFGPAGGDFVCRIYALAGAAGGTAAIMTLTLISIDRYNVIVFPLNPSRSTTNLRSKLMILFIWLYSAPFVLIPLFEVGDIKYIPEGFMTACSYDYLNTSHENYVFIFVYTIFAWVVPLVAIAYCYVHILYIVLSAKKIQSSKEKNKTEMKLAGIVIGIVGLWFLAWTPYAVVSLLGIFGYKDYITPLGSMIPAIFAKTAACIDPYLYAVSHPRFRTQLEKMFCTQASGDTQMQTSHYSRGMSQVDDCETVNLEDTVPNKKRLERATSSVCEESSISASVDCNDNNRKY